jgi:hypothetical protein
MPERLDDEIRALVHELVAASPPPPDRPGVLGSRHGLGPGLTASVSGRWVLALAVLAVGTAGVLLGRYVLPAEPALEDQPRVVAGTPAPEPRVAFDHLGDEVPLLPPSHDVEPTLTGDTVVGDVAAVGVIAGTDIEVFAWQHLVEDLTASCIQVVSPATTETLCTASRDTPTPHTPYPFRYRDADGVAVIVALWVVPEGTSVASLEIGDHRVWQRPVGGVTAFALRLPDFPTGLFESWDADGESLARISFDSMPSVGFSQAMGSVLVFDDGLTGVTVVDLDTGDVVRRGIDGQRPGASEHRLTRVGNSLVVGWGRIHAVSIETLDSVMLGEATVFVPAVEPDTVWLVDYPGGRIGQGTPTFRHIRLNGDEISSAEGVPPEQGFAVRGVPGGLVLEGDLGLTLWYPSGEVAPIPGTSRAFVGDTSGDQIAWCEAGCAELRIGEIGGADISIPAPAETSNFDARSARFSPDGRLLAAIVGDAATAGTGSHGSLVMVDVVTGAATLITERLLPRPSYIAWSQDGRHLFFSSNSYGEPETLLGWYRPADGHLEVITFPYGGMLSFVVLTSDEAAALRG